MRASFILLSHKRIIIPGHLTRFIAFVNRRNIHWYGTNSQEIRSDDKKNKQNQDICNYGWITILKTQISLGGSGDYEQLHLLVLL